MCRRCHRSPRAGGQRAAPAGGALRLLPPRSGQCWRRCKQRCRWGWRRSQLLALVLMCLMVWSSLLLFPLSLLLLLEWAAFQWFSSPLYFPALLSPCKFCNAMYIEQWRQGASLRGARAHCEHAGKAAAEANHAGHAGDEGPLLAVRGRRTAVVGPWGCRPPSCRYCLGRSV